ncbi:MAG: NAD(P)-dependent oxidoreductase [Asgard group archaeon]|nr:NAD(P)-dependent oxidoreductase [Asgard group archaeon]
MAILLTGGAGFVGYHLAKRLVEAEKEIVIFDIQIDKVEEEIEGVILIEGDITDIQQVEDLFKKYNFTSIFHLATLMPPLTEEDPYKAFQVNVEGTMNVIKTACNYNVENFIYPSSATVFGPDRKPPFTVEDLLHPWTVYSSFKVCTEIIGSIYSKKFDINFRAVRFPIIVGPGRNPFLGITRYPSQMIDEAVKGKPVVAEVSPDAEVPIIYIDDAVQMLINLWRSKDIEFEIINVDGIWITAKELAEGIKKVIPSAKIEFKPPRDEHVQKVLSGVQEKKDEDKYSFRGKRLLEEIIQEYVSRSKDED